MLSMLINMNEPEAELNNEKFIKNAPEEQYPSSPHGQ